MQYILLFLWLISCLCCWETQIKTNWPDSHARPGELWCLSARNGTDVLVLYLLLRVSRLLCSLLQCFWSLSCGWCLASYLTAYSEGGSPARAPGTGRVLLLLSHGVRGPGDLLHAGSRRQWRWGQVLLAAKLGMLLKHLLADQWWHGGHCHSRPAGPLHHPRHLTESHLMQKDL